MSVSGDVGIHSKSDSSPTLQLCSVSCQNLKFRCALHIEKQNIGLESSHDLRNCLANPRKDDAFCRFAIGAKHTLQFAARDHVEAAIEPCQQPENAEIRVGLHRIADRVLNAPKGSVKSRNAFANRFRGIDVQRSAEALGQLRQGDSLTVEYI